MISNLMKNFYYENTIGYAAYASSKAFQHCFDIGLRKKTGITLTQAKVIFVLDRHDGITQRELAEKIGIEAPTLVPIIDKMEKEEYVTRKDDTDDRRIKRIFATKKTGRLWKDMLECGAQIRKVYSEDVSEEEIQSAMFVLKKITSNLEKYVEKHRSKNSID